MKFTTKTKLLISIVFISILVFSQATNLNKKNSPQLENTETNKNQTSTLRTEALTEEESMQYYFPTNPNVGTDKTIPILEGRAILTTGNALGNYLAGFMEAFQGQYVDIYKCIPFSLTSINNAAPSSEDSDYDQTGFKLIAAFPYFKKLVDNMSKGVCDNRHSLVSFFSQLYIKPSAVKSLKRNKLFFIEKSSKMKSLVKNSAFAKTKINIFGFEFSWKKIVETTSYFKTWFDDFEKIRVNIDSYVKWFYKTTQRIQPLLTCANTIGHIFPDIRQKFEKLKEIVSYAESSTKISFGNYVAAFDALTGAICEKDNFLQTNYYLNEAYKTTDFAKRWVFAGRAASFFMRSVMRENTLGNSKLAEFTKNAIGNLIFF